MADATERRPREVDRLWELNKPGAALFRSVGRISGVFLLALGVSTASAALGLLRRKQWAWFAVILFVIDASGDVVSLFVTGDWFRSIAGVAVSATFLCFLCQRNVREFFKHAYEPRLRFSSALLA